MKNLQGKGNTFRAHEVGLGTKARGTLPLASQVTKGGLNGLTLRTSVNLKSSVLRVTTVNVKQHRSW